MKRNRLLIVISVLVGLMMACNISIGGDTPPTTTPVVIVVTQIVPADTDVPQVEATETPEEVVPTEEPTIAMTSTASTPMVTPLKDPVNCRFGPSVGYEQVSALNVGAYMPVVGKSADGGWWLVGIPNSDNRTCWVGKTVTTITGETGSLPTVPAPEAFVTDVQLQIKPKLFNLGPGCTNIPSSPFTLTGIISTNGPLEIKWRIETEQDGRMPEKSLKFDKFGPHPVSFTFAPSTWEKGNFWIRIVVLKPVSMAADVTYQVKCE